MRRNYVVNRVSMNAAWDKLVEKHFKNWNTSRVAQRRPEEVEIFREEALKRAKLQVRPSMCQC
jgi:hypothetical protein